MYLILPCDGRDVKHGGEHLRGAAHVLGRPSVLCLLGVDAQAARLAFREYHHVLRVLGLAPGIADEVPLFPGDFRVVEQPALFGVFLDLVEVVVVVLVFGGEDFDEEASLQKKWWIKDKFNNKSKKNLLLWLHRNIFVYKLNKLINYFNEKNFNNRG